VKTNDQATAADHRDLRDDRAKTNPGRWQPQGSPQTENDIPQGGLVPLRDYHRRGHFTDMPDTQPMDPRGNK
jgi:hypothetical protein